MDEEHFDSVEYNSHLKYKKKLFLKIFKDEKVKEEEEENRSTMTNLTL
jgi:hypothetical protein